MDEQIEGKKRFHFGGIAGLAISTFAAACCLGATPVIGFLVTIGLGLFNSDFILIPILVVGIMAVV